MRQLLPLLLLVGGPMSAQPPTVTVNDYLKEVRIFPGPSAEFSRIASDLGVSASLASLGPGLPLVAAIRNDSSQPVELRVLFLLRKEGTTTPRDLQMGESLQAGGGMLVAPREVRGALGRLASLGQPGEPGAFTGLPTVGPLDAYQGATLSISVDSATLADGRFIGADTQHVFDRLVKQDAARRAFFRDAAGFSQLTQPQIEQALTARKAAADSALKQSVDITELSFASQTESGLSSEALLRLQHFGMASLVSWVARENQAIASKLALHK